MTRHVALLMQPLFKCSLFFRRQWTTSKQLKAHDKPVSSLAIFGDNLATGSSDGTLSIWRHDPSIDGEHSSTSLTSAELNGSFCNS